MISRVYVDSFRGAASELPRGKRQATEILRVLSKHPRVSTFDMCEHRWLSNGIQFLEKEGLIAEDKEPYPWHKYVLTENGKLAIENI